MTKIKAPNGQYAGVSASVSFRDGIGETNDPKLIKWFESHGYEVIGEEGDSEVPEPEVPEALEESGIETLDESELVEGLGEEEEAPEEAPAKPKRGNKGK